MASRWPSSRRAATPASAPARPIARFNVVGTSWFQGDSTPLPPEAGKGIAIGFAGEQGYIYGFDYATWTHKNLIVQHDGGKVAIGTSTPAAAKLTIVAPAGEAGLVVGSAGLDGVRVTSATNDGVSVGYAGRYGLYIPASVSSAVTILSAGGFGVRVDYAGIDGVVVGGAADSGIDATGNQYAGLFRGNINVLGNCIGCLQANFAVNAGDHALQPGDPVSILAVTRTDFDTGPALWQVTQAQPGQAIVGVAAGRAEVEIREEHRATETGKRLVPREGAAQPGDYVSIVYSGPMQVRATGPVLAGAKLTIDDNGGARGLRKTEVNGVPIAEDAPVLGIALSESQDGMVWVLVNPQ